jgi:hypothetical protein
MHLLVVETECAIRCGAKRLQRDIARSDRTLRLGRMDLCANLR